MCPDQNRQGRRCAAFFYTPVLSRMIGHPLYNWVAANGNRLSSVRLERVNSRDLRRKWPPGPFNAISLFPSSGDDEVPASLPLNQSTRSLSLRTIEGLSFMLSIRRHGTPYDRKPA